MSSSSNYRKMLARRLQQEAGARGERLSFMAALRQVEAGARPGHDQPTLGEVAVAAWETPLAGDRRRALRALAERALAERAADLGRGPLKTITLAFQYAGAVQPWNVTVIPGFADELVEALEDGRGLVPHDETTLEKAFEDEPLWAIGGALHEMLTDNGDEAIGWLMDPAIACTEPARRLDSAGTGPAAGRQILEQLAELPRPRNDEQALATLRRVLAAVFPGVATADGQSGIISEVTQADSHHAYARVLERADFDPQRQSVRQAWMNLIPLLRNASAPGAALLDLELCERAAWDLGGAALRDVRRLLLEHGDIGVEAPAVPQWPHALLEATRDVPLDWRRDGASASDTIARWTPVVHDRVDRATLGRPVAAERARALYGVARLCAELHAALRTAGVEYA